MAQALLEKANQSAIDKDKRTPFSRSALAISSCPLPVAC